MPAAMSSGRRQSPLNRNTSPGLGTGIPRRGLAVRWRRHRAGVRGAQRVLIRPARHCRTGVPRVALIALVPGVTLLTGVAGVPLVALLTLARCRRTRTVGLYLSGY